MGVRESLAQAAMLQHTLGPRGSQQTAEVVMSGRCEPLRMSPVIAGACVPVTAGARLDGKEGNEGPLVAAGLQRRNATQY